MHCYLVRFKRHGYDQYDAFVVVARCEADAIDALRDPVRLKAFDEYVGDDGLSIDWSGGCTVEKIFQEEAAIILGSFNAG